MVLSADGPRHRYLKDFHVKDDFARPPDLKGGNSSSPLCSLVEYVERYFVSGRRDLLPEKVSDRSLWQTSLRLRTKEKES
jgi:hypothetical protein